MIPAFYRVCKWLRNNKLSLNIVKTEFTESTPYTIVVEGQEVTRVKLNKKWSVVSMVTALASDFYFWKTENFTRISFFLDHNTGGLSDLKVLVSMI